MNKLYRKTIFLFPFFFFLATGLSAQQNHFIYLQTENKQPFYIKLDKKILSSSASGYLIIPKLQDGSYILTVGFPKNEWPEQNVTCPVNKKDAGYLLKNFGDKGWGLFNLQSMEVVMSGIKVAEKSAVAEENKPDIFSNTLSNVVNDPSIAKKTVEKAVIKEELKPVTDVIAKETPPIVPMQITKLLSSQKAEGTELVYIDVVNGQADTVKILIPDETKEIIPQPEKKIEAPIVEAPKKEESPKEEIKNEPPPKGEIAKETVKSNAPKFIDIELANPNAKADTTLKLPEPTAIVEKKVDTIQPAPGKPKEKMPKTVILNSDCKNFASEDDFLKLRKKMAAEDNDEGMIAVSKKIFKSKCFTSDQIKNLSVLFLKDEGKYNFFDAAYPFVSDSYNFGSLEEQLSDTYFITRFKAMIRH